jgi:DNA-binding transcriptional LysR family regulator
LPFSIDQGFETGAKLAASTPLEKWDDHIAIIDGMNFATFDLNLLRVFDAMMQARNTTRAGERLGLSQPAVSNALARLRHAIGDDLFVRRGQKMDPTPRALAAAGPIRAALREVEATLSRAAGFDPATASRRFVIAGSDYASTLLMPPLAARVAERAPGVVIQFLDAPPGGLAARLGSADADLFIDSARETPTGWRGASCTARISSPWRPGTIRRCGARWRRGARSRRSCSAPCPTSSAPWTGAWAARSTRRCIAWASAAASR